MKTTLQFLLPVLLCFAVGVTASLFQAEALASWYPTLAKATLTPPNAVFPIAWSLLYLCMGISLGLVLRKNGPDKKLLINLFAAQLLFNFLWSFLFFTLRNPLMGFIDILMLDGLVLWYTLAAWKVSRAASGLFIPYLAWLLFATYLNGYILICK